jgi:hypothetical protein
MSIRRVLQTLIAALLTTFALVSVAQPSTAATSTFNITGVASLDGKGVAGITAHLLQSDTEGDSYEHYGNAVTNSKGSYTFSKVPIGSADGYSYVVVFTDSTHKVVTEERHLVPKANKTVTRNVTLERAATLSGTLSRQDGVAPHNITARIFGGGVYEPRDNGVDRYNDPIVLHVHSNGSYEFVGLPAGKYGVQFTDDSEKYLDQCYDNALAGLRDGHYPECTAEITPAATMVTVTGGQHATLDPQTMSHLANRISGTVTDTDGHALKGIDVVAFPSGDGTTNGPLWSSTSDASGAFTVAGLPAGGWQLRAEDTGNIWAPQWYDRKASQGESTVVPGGATGINIKMLSRSILKATATAGTKSATFEVLTTRKAGGARPGGSVTVNQGSKTTTGDLVNGRATIKLTGLTPGKRTITVTYSGNSSTAGTSKTVVVMVK